MKKQSKQLNIFIKSTAIMLIWAMLCSNIAYAAPVCNLAVPKVVNENLLNEIDLSSLIGEQQFYNEALTAFENKNYDSANILLEKAIYGARKNGNGVLGLDLILKLYKNNCQKKQKAEEILKKVNELKIAIKNKKELEFEKNEEQAYQLQINNDAPRLAEKDFGINKHPLKPFLTAMMGYCYRFKDKGSIDDQEFAEEIIKICNQIKNKFGKQDLYKHIENSLEAIHNKANIIIYQDELDLMTVSIPKKIEILVKRIDKICREECMEKISVKQKIEVPGVNMINPQLSLSHSLNNQV